MGIFIFLIERHSLFTPPYHKERGTLPAPALLPLQAWEPGRKENWKFPPSWEGGLGGWDRSEEF
jgi:hypothetical protein